MNQQISCEAGSDATNRRACAAGSCPIASTASASGGAAAGWRPASGLGRRRRRWSRPAAARPAAWRHVASRGPQRRGASRAGQLAGRQHVHRPAEGEADQHGVVEDPAADHAGPDRCAARERGGRWPVPRPVVGRHRARPARPVTSLATRAAHRLVRACRRRAHRCSGGQRRPLAHAGRSGVTAGCRRGTRARQWQER